MWRARMLCFFLLALGGCRTATPVPVIDPFEGRTRVPPPGTGEISAFTPNDPYYNGSGGATTAPSLGPLQFTPRVGSNVSLPATPASSGRSYDEPPGTRWGDTSAVPSTLTPINPGSSNLPQPLAPPPPPGGSNPVTLPPRPTIPAGSLPPPPATGSRYSATTPGADPFASSAGTAYFEPSPFRPASTTVPAPIPNTYTNDPPGATIWRGTGDSYATTAAASGGSYYHNAQYTLLRGRLEFSRVNRTWKLRYIPVSGMGDGATDEFGGSVVLEDTPAMSDMRDGDFVEVQGSLRDMPSGQGYAPFYATRSIRRL